jgi:hypothetical protein
MVALTLSKSAFVLRNLVAYRLQLLQNILTVLLVFSSNKFKTMPVWIIYSDMK